MSTTYSLYGEQILKGLIRKQLIQYEAERQNLTATDAEVQERLKTTFNPWPGAEQYRQRRNLMVKGLHEAGWMVENPKASMYIWAKIPEPYAHLGSLEFAKKLLADAKVSVSPGIGFGEYGDDHVRFALIENQDRIRQAIRGIKAMYRADGLVTPPAKARKTEA